MRKFVCIILAVFICISTASAYAQNHSLDDCLQTATIDYINPDQKVTFIVEVEGEPLLKSTQLRNSAVFSQLEAKLFDIQQGVVNGISDVINSAIDCGFVYTALFNGFSFSGKYGDLQKLQAVSGVKNVYISEEINTIEPIIETDNAAVSAYSSEITEYDGEGILIGVIDTGFQKEHEFFAEAPENPRLSKAELDKIIKNNALNSGVVSADSVYVNEKIPYAYNYYTKSYETYMSGIAHGIHVSGIAAGKNGRLPNDESFSGVAPEAQLLFFGCGNNSGGISDDNVLAAINDAALLGVDVINMSFGVDYADVSNKSLYENIINNAYQAGIAVMSASGNAYRGFSEKTPKVENIDYSTAGAPACYANTTAVASVDSPQAFRNVLKFRDSGNSDVTLFIAHENSLITDIFTDSGYIEYVDCNLGNEEDFSGKDLTGKIALVKRGELDFTQKALNAEKANAAGIIIYNYEDFYFACADELCIPAATATLSQGEKLSGLADKRLSFVSVAVEQVPMQNGGKPSAFSSWGVDSSLQLKPEISAPGGNIYSSVYDNKYGLMSGTSMATPYMTGVMALMLEYYKTNPFLDQFNNLSGSEKIKLLENIAMTSAEIARNDSSNVPYSPRKQGSGVVSMPDILKSKVIIKGDADKAKLSLGDDISDTLDLDLTMTNISDEAVTFDEISVEVVTDGYFTENDINYVGDTVSLDVVEDNLPESITVQPGDTYVFSATVRLDREQLLENSKIFKNGFFIDGFIIFDTSNDTTRASVPFTGFYGDWGKAPVFDKTIYDEDGSELAISGKEKISGTFLASNTSNGYIPLGQNGFNSSVFSSDNVVFSTNNGNELLFLSTDFRSTDYTLCSIKDASGRTVYKAASNSFKNKFNMSGFSLPNAGLKELSNGEFKFCVTSTVAGPTDTAHTLEIPFYIDSTYPGIKSVEYNEAAKTVTVKAADNKALSAIYVAYTDTEGKKTKDLKPLTLEESEGLTATKIFDVSKAESLNSVAVGCFDYALNETGGYYYYFANDIGLEVVKLTRADGVTSLTAAARNNTDADIKGQLTAAFYDENGVLVSVKAVSETFAANTEKEVLFAMLSDTQSAAALKLFIWKNNNLISISEPRAIRLEVIN